MNKKKQMKYPDDFLNKFICGNTVDVMKEIPDNSIDLIVTSPPYNLKNSTGNGMKDGRGGKWSNAALVSGYSHHNDNMPHNEYVKWQRDCLSEMLRIIPENGAIFYNHKWRVQAGLLQDRNDIVSGLPVRQIIIWKRKGGINKMAILQECPICHRKQTRRNKRCNKCENNLDKAKRAQKIINI